MYWGTARNGCWAVSGGLKQQHFAHTQHLLSEHFSFLNMKVLPFYTGLSKGLVHKLHHPRSSVGWHWHWYTSESQFLTCLLLRLVIYCSLQQQQTSIFSLHWLSYFGQKVGGGGTKSLLIPLSSLPTRGGSKWEISSTYFYMPGPKVWGHVYTYYGLTLLWSMQRGSI